MNINNATMSNTVSITSSLLISLRALNCEAFERILDHITFLRFFGSKLVLLDTKLTPPLYGEG